ncbi:UBX domain-containing protein 5 [Diplogelasinospora grovesii]|uniref:UBX domain-containing protein 5 n=1 Tax=Diplogelasinospora grovesii TaxID=303347 RepID=A0AAN6S3R5_9PEZI|nr:UBX domain-containing protein 5 [Diplogelasinospora grovesii]
MDQDIAGFVSITGSSEDAARQVLEMCGGDMEQAVQLWFADEELQRNLNNPSSSSIATPSPAPVAASSRSRTAPPAQPVASSSRSNNRQIGREDARGVIHIDSDDEDDFPMNEDDGDFGAFDDDEAVAATVARTAQEEEDAAIAKRLQEELYSGQAADEDGVRAPMARTTETLIAPSAGPGGFMDDQESTILEQLRRRRQAHGRSRNPFSQSVWEEPVSNARPTPGPQPSRSTRLAELFRPPYDLMARFSWDEARDEGKEQKKWILVNLQDMSDFNCQALNRDIWKDQPIRQLVAENFIFLQYEKSDPQAEQYTTFYFPNRTHENPNNYPHVSIIDPRTGEQVKVWSGIPFPSALDFHAQLVEFLDRYSLAANSKNPVVKTKRPERVVDVDRMTEEEMLQMAMQNSLETNGTTSKPNVVDPDELTKLEDVKGKARADSDEDVEMSATAGSSAAQESAFARIPSDRPHTEPANNPATTTRIQFRHPTGRVIRRFNLDDPVSRIYEWLKAEPLEGKEGLEFELKVVPQGHDLIVDLDKTISEVGLKQGTVMIEFITED